MTVVEIVQMVQQGKNKDNEDLSNSEEDEEGVQQRMSVHNCIQLITDSIEGLKQRHIFSTRNYYCPHSARMSQYTKTKVHETKQAG